MFQRILIAWPQDRPPGRSLRIARELANAYDAELTVCCLGDGAVAAQAAVGAEAQIVSRPAGNEARELLRYAHEHAFDLLVVGRAHDEEPSPGRLIESASLPLLVVLEDET